MSAGFNITIVYVDCDPISTPSEIQTILGDLATLNIAVGYNLGNVTAYTGGNNLTQELGLLGAKNLVTDALVQTASDVDAAGRLSVEDSTSVLDSISVIHDQLLLVLSGFRGKASAFEAAGLSASVLAGMQTHHAHEIILYDAIEAKAQPTDVPSFLSLEASLGTAYNVAIAEFS